MPKTRCEHDEVSAMLDLLFDLPADAQPDVDDAVEQVDPAEARRCLVERLEHGYHRGDSALFQALFDRIGVGEQSESLRALLRDSEAPMGARATALEVLTTKGGENRSALLSQLSERDRERLIDEPLRELIADAIEDVVAAEVIAVVAEHFPNDARTALEDHLERLRKQMGAPATTLYEDLLRSPRLASLHEPMIEAIVGEASISGRRLLRQLRDDASDPDVRKRYESALARLAEVTPDEVPSGGGRLGPIDAACRFEVAILLDRSDGTRTLAMLVLCGDRILDGFADYDPPEELLGSNHLPGREVSLDAVGSLVRPALEQLRWDELDGATLAAIRLFELLRPGEPIAVPPLSDPLDLAEVERLIEGEACRLWIFTPSDLHDAGIPEPPVEPSPEWLEQQLARLDQPRLRQKLTLAAKTASRWYAAAGQPREAGIMARIAEELERHLPEGIARPMLSRSVDRLHRSLPDVELDGDEIDESELNGVGWDLSRLDRKNFARVVERQIREGDPAIVRETFEELCKRGRTDEEAVARIVEALEHEIQEMLQTGTRNGGRYTDALRALVARVSVDA